MGIKDEIEQGLIGQLVMSRMQHSMPDWMNRKMDWQTFKRILPRQQKFLDRLIDMQTFFTEITGREPKKVFMGWSQQRELQDELRSMHTIMMPHKGYAGMLIGMDVIFVLEDSRLEVTC